MYLLLTTLLILQSAPGYDVIGHATSQPDQGIKILDKIDRLMLKPANEIADGNMYPEHMKSFTQLESLQISENLKKLEKLRCSIYGDGLDGRYKKSNCLNKK